MGNVSQSDDDDGEDVEDGDDDNDENDVRGLFVNIGISHNLCCCPVFGIHSLAELIG